MVFLVQRTPWTNPNQDGAVWISLPSGRFVLVHELVVWIRSIPTTVEPSRLLSPVGSSRFSVGERTLRLYRAHYGAGHLLSAACALDGYLADIFNAEQQPTDD